jgi:hypothetical protein
VELDPPLPEEVATVNPLVVTAHRSLLKANTVLSQATANKRASRVKASMALLPALLDTTVPSLKPVKDSRASTVNLNPSLSTALHLVSPLDLDSRPLLRTVNSLVKVNTASSRDRDSTDSSRVKDKGSTDSSLVRDKGNMDSSRVKDKDSTANNPDKDNMANNPDKASTVSSPDKANTVSPPHPLQEAVV